jgi:hypothetical protein
LTERPDLPAGLRMLIDCLTEFARTGRSVMDIRLAAQLAAQRLKTAHDILVCEEARHASHIKWLNALARKIRSGGITLDEVLFQLEQHAELDDVVKMQVAARKRRGEEG